MQNIKYFTYITILAVLLSGTATALPTNTHGIVDGEMYVAATANWPSRVTTNTFDVPNGTVVYAKYYVGVWTAGYTLSSISTTFNGHAFPTNPGYYSSDMGAMWIPYDITDHVIPGAVNTVTVDSNNWGDGRQYGSTIVVVLENESKPQIEYWVAEGLDWMHYAGYVGYAVDNSTTHFNGVVDTAYLRSANLYSTHLTGFNYEELNGNSLPGASESVGGEYFNYLGWDGVEGSIVPGNQTVLVSRVNDDYCSAVFHALSIEYYDKVCGDVTGDGLVDTGDVILLSNYVGYPGYTLPKEWAGDVTSDGLIDTGDVILLSNYVGYPGYSLNCI